MTVPATLPLISGDFAHPSWCDPRFCGRSNPVPCHLSAPLRIAENRIGGVVITAQLTCVIDEPLETAPVSIEMVIRDPVTGKAGRYLLDEEVARALHATLGALVPMTS
ncbi:hypothetical protein Val02_81130 [Virgisporangium aliadipatigenens]|uniref:Uncharacterized protein n=1 Tax=Virgisporangium aliadipatigenens TaxID=741659 RepID=A0A8J3YV42_9ACTN|nr:hypothetical protein [Virgisporangium aliadipatigenens]GIJ51227.1 hypothetical protein Val02_81130 [Virgisporangium aliadipatigenens]